MITLCVGIQSGIFAIAQSHSNFTKNICNDCHEVDAFACATKLLNKEKEKEENTEGLGSECILCPDAAS